MYKAFTKHRRLNNDVMICFVKFPYRSLYSYKRRAKSRLSFDVVLLFVDLNKFCLRNQVRLCKFFHKKYNLK